MNSSTVEIKIQSDSRSAQADLKRFAGEVDDLGKKGSGAANTMATSWKALAGVVAGVSFAAISRQVLDIADQYTMLESRLKLVTSSSAELRSVQEALYQISLSTHQSNAETITLYTKMASATRSLGMSQADTLQITESINQALVVSGASAAESGAALQQLGQGLASGVLRGEEFNSVMEQTPRLAKALADGLGVDIGQLRKMAEEGKLTADVVTKALLSQKDVIEGEFRQMTTTVSQAMTDLGTVVKSIIADANDASGATAGIVTKIEDLAATIDANRDGILSLFSAIVEGAGWAVEGIASMVREVKAFSIMLASKDKSFTDWAFGSDADFKKWIKDVDSGIAFLDDRLAELAEKRKDVAESWAFTSEARKQKQDELAAIDKQIAAIEEQKQAVKAAASEAKKSSDQHVASWQAATNGVKKHYGAVKVESDKSEKDHAKAEKKKTETTKKEVENRNRYYEMYGIAERAEIESLTDSWAVMERGRTENTQAQNQAIVESNEETTGLIGEQWNTSFESIQGAISDMIYEMDFSAKSIVDIFKRMLADILAAILMSGIKSALGELLGFTNTGSVWGAFGSGISSAFGGGSGGGLGGLFGGSGGSGGTGAASGWGMVGGGLALAGGAYGLYSGAKNMGKGNTGAGAAQMGLGAVSAYNGAVTLGLVEKGTATGVYNAMAAKITGAGVEKAIATGTTTAISGTAAAGTQGVMASYGMGSAHASLAAAEASSLAGSGGTGAAGAGAGASGGMAAGAAVGAAYAIPALAAALVAKGIFDKSRRPSASAEIDEYGITPAMLGQFTSGMKAVQGSILATVPTLSRYETAQYNAEHGILALTSSTGTLALKYNESAAAGHQWSTYLHAGVIAMDEASRSASSLGQSLGYADGEINTSIEAMHQEAGAVRGLTEIMNGSAAGAQSMGNAINGLSSAYSNAASGTESMENSVTGLYPAVSAATESLNSFASGMGSMSSNAMEMAYRMATWSSPGTQSMENHAEGGIFPGVTVWGSHRIGEAGTEALIPLPDGPDTMSKIIDRLDRIESDKLDSSEIAAILWSIATNSKKTAAILSRFEYTGIPQSTREAVA